MSFKELHDALEQVALNLEEAHISAEEWEEAWELAQLVVDGLQELRKRRKEQHEREDETPARKTG